MSKVFEIQPSFVEYAKTLDASVCWQDGVYLLCRRLPKHENSEVVSAKIGLIRRSTGNLIERGRDRSNLARDYHDDLIASALVNSRLDEFLTSLREFSTFDSSAIDPVVRCHKYLMDEMEYATGVGMSSLASRYLHYHLPRVVPLFDERLGKALSKFSPNRIQRSELPTGGDPHYTIFCARIALLQNALESQHGVRLTLRQIDRLLMAMLRGEPKPES